MCLIRCFCTSLFLALLSSSVMADGLGLGDRFKGSSSQQSNNSQIGASGFKSPEEVKQFMSDNGVSIQGKLNSGEFELNDSYAFDGFYSIYMPRKGLPAGIMFSKTESYVLFYFDPNNNSKPKLYEAVNGRLSPSLMSLQDFINKKLITNIRPDQFIKVGFNSDNPKLYVLSAADCPYCKQFEKQLYKHKVNHYVIPKFTLNEGMPTDESRENNRAVACGGEAKWVNWMIKDKPLVGLKSCKEKYYVDYALTEVGDALNQIGFQGYPAAIIVKEHAAGFLKGAPQGEDEFMKLANYLKN